MGRTADWSLTLGGLAIVIGFATGLVVAGRGDLQPQGVLDWLTVALLLALTASAFRWPAECSMLLWGLVLLFIIGSLEAASAEIGVTFDPVLAVLSGVGLLVCVATEKRKRLSVDLGETGSLRGS